jgi:hypothetical protein
MLTIVLYKDKLITSIDDYMCKKCSEVARKFTQIPQLHAAFPSPLVNSQGSPLQIQYNPVQTQSVRTNRSLHITL